MVNFWFRIGWLHKNSVYKQIGYKQARSNSHPQMKHGYGNRHLIVTNLNLGPSRTIQAVTKSDT